jgi:hypothetical protein
MTLFEGDGAKVIDKLMERTLTFGSSNWSGDWLP